MTTPEVLRKQWVSDEPREWLIRKGGYFYGVDWCGYTTQKDDAGRYTEAEARKEAEIEPWDMSAVHQDSLPRTPLDDARAEIAQLREKARDAGALGLAMHQEIQRLREALATAKRDAWIAGRDAAATRARVFQDIIGWQPGESRNALIGDIECAIRALAPPAEADGRMSHEDQ